MIFALLGVTWGCQRAPASDHDAHVTEQGAMGLPADFIQFYTRFHGDSAFQMTRINFPLEGLPAIQDSLFDPAAFRWQSAEWVLHKPFINDNDRYQQEFDVLGEDLVVETISDRQLPLTMQRRFARMSEGWHLIYYIEMQPMARSQ